MRLTVILLLLLFSDISAQELICNIRVNANQIQTSDKKIFNSLQSDLYEFVNNTKWTNTNFQSEERIECSILINISKMISNDDYLMIKGSNATGLNNFTKKMIKGI